MSRDLELQGDELRRAVEGLKRSYRAQRIPTPVRRRVVAFAARARAGGVSWSALAEATGLAKNTLKRWLAGGRAPLVAVEISNATTSVSSTSSTSKRSMTLVLPSGVRLEGVGVAEAVELARALG